ncbi:MAG: GWxTD domain-containing protein, partial [Pyrinomonadaceae bacterium]
MLATRIILIFSALFVTVNIGAQPATKTRDPQDKPRRVKQEPHKAFKEWLQEVEPIVRPGELDAWNKLDTDEEREQFILEFWRLRDTDPDTEANEYR